ncbi:Protein ALP1-like [Holothuria leucospilota]|uniref:Putative nuclease HARBI1 n=1 Tax=Holothuria leucospilota TaxID=206669 RepID=A0A9Q1HKZ8_HOLLE|nr:Protein ALP1-like [Holothuria leucospilota]
MSDLAGIKFSIKTTFLVKAMAVYMAFGLLERENQRARRRERVFRDRTNPLDLWTDQQMYAKYRFSRLACINIIDMLQDELEHRTRRNHALPPSLQVFIALRFFGHGSVTDDSGAEPHGVSIPTACRAVRRVTKALCRRQNQFIKFPTTPEEVQQKQRDFMAIQGFPRVVGAIDGTHIRLTNVALGPTEYVYVNRKGFYSINVQLVCDAKYRILNVVARWPGSTHDSRILQESRLGHAFRDGQLQGILLGDSGYALKPWLMTPFLIPQTPAEQAYNSAHRTTRALIEHLNGQLKNKFLCLGGTGPRVRTAEKVCDIITACCVLFNISKDDHIQEPYNHIPDDDNPAPEAAADDDVHGTAVRNDIVRNFFTQV